MVTITEKIDPQGRISIIRILDGTDIKPGDLVEVIPERNKIVLKVVKQKAPGGVIDSVAGKWKNRPDIIMDILNSRIEKDSKLQPQP